MGKLLCTEDGEHIDNIHLGCMSRVFPVLDYQNWHSNVKKILPYRKHADRSTQRHNSHTRSIKDSHKKRSRKLQRTYSIHHLKTDEWVLPVVLDSQIVNNEEFSVKKDTNQEIEDYVDISEDSKINKNISPRILQDGSQVSLEKSNLTKSSSFPSMLSTRKLKPTTKLNDFYSVPKNEKGSGNLARKLDLSKLESSMIELDQQDGLKPLCIPEEEVKSVNTNGHNDDEYFNYVREILERSGFIKNGFEQTWYASNKPLNPSMFQEIESQYPYDPQCFEEELLELSYRLHRFELVDEILLKLYERSFSFYPKPLSYCCHLSGKFVLEEVWKILSRLTDMDESSIVCWDLRVGDEWMNLQMESECIALELEDMIFNQLLGEVLCS